MRGAYRAGFAGLVLQGLLVFVLVAPARSSAVGPLAQASPGAGVLRCGGMHDSGVTLAGANAAPQAHLQDAQFGTKPFVTILCRFADSTNLTPHPKSYYQAMMGSAYPGMDNYWREVSYNNINLSGSVVVGWYNLPQPKSYYQDSSNICGVDIDKLKADATAVALADVHFNDFYGINIVVNDDTGGLNCGWSCQDMTLQGVTRCWGMTFITRGGADQTDFAHEMGHALGLDHSSGPYTQTYDSKWDVMSGGYNCSPPVSGYGCVAVHTNAYHKDVLGWIPPARKYIGTPGTSQTITLERLAQPVQTDDFLMAQAYIGGWATRFYTFEARRFAGYDSVGGIPGEAVVIHKVDTTLPDRRSQVVDVDNNGDPNDAGAMWTPGETFSDPANGISMTVDSETASGFVVTITVSANAVRGNVVTNTSDGGPGSLRNAINWANQFPGTTIRFNIPATDPGFDGTGFNIQPGGPLPAITAAGTIIDGTTEIAFAGDTNVGGPNVVLDGSNAGQYAVGLEITAPDCVVKRLVINSFNGDGIQIHTSSATGNTVTGCYVGTDVSGLIAMPNGWAGIDIFDGAANNTVGGTTPGSANVLSGNAQIGVAITGPGSTGNVVEGNRAGLDPTGMVAVANGWSGVWIGSGATGNTVGGLTPGARNTISGNLTGGVSISDPGTSGNTVVGNYVGTDVSGSVGVANGYAGVEVFNKATNNTVGGTSAAARNVLSGNTTAGASISDAGTSGNVIEGNYIGVDATGEVALGNTWGGVQIQNGASDNTVGGLDPGARNVVSGNSTDGIAIRDPGSSGNVVEGNYVGVDQTGTAAIANGWGGVDIFIGASGNTIGGASAAARNIISGNSTVGVAVTDSGTTGNLVEGNYIGTDATGAGKVPNGWSGVEAFGGSTGNIIGGVNPGQGNIIAYNGGRGVIIYDATTTGITIRGNSIFGNGGLGIDLAGGSEDGYGVTANHSGGPGSGPNDLQNYPVLSSLSGAGSLTSTVSGTLSSAPSGTFTIDFYRSPQADPSGHGQGEFYLGSTTVSTDASGSASFTFVCPTGAAPVSDLSATATAPDGSTSEFARDYRVTASPPALFITGRDITQAIMGSAQTNFTFRVWGRVTTVDGSTFMLDDGSGSPVKIVAPGYSLSNGDFATATGQIDVSASPPTLTVSAPGGVQKLN